VALRTVTGEAVRHADEAAAGGDVNAIATRGLSKEFNGAVAVDGIDLQVPEGSVFGFLGPNGSGKTTTTRMLLGLMRPSGGEIEVLGQSMPQHIMAVLPSVGALVEGSAFYPFLSGARNLARLDAAEGGTRTTRRSRTADALDRVGLSAASDKRYRQYSLGMKQRLALAAALLRPRRLIVLDEPTNGLDPQGTREVRDLIRTLAADGTTVFLSSHLLHEVEQVCTHAAILSRGRILRQGSLPALTGTSRTARITVSHPAAAAVVLSQLPGLGDVQVDGSTVLVELRDVLPQLCNRTLVEHGIDVAGLVVAQPSLEDLFVSVTGDASDVG